MLTKWFRSGGDHMRRRNDLPEPPPRPWPRLWAPAVILGGVALIATALLPEDSPTADFLFLAATLIAIAFLLGGALVATRLRTIWWALLANQVLTLTGVAIAWVERNSNPSPTFPDLSDFITLLSYVPAFIALGVMIHHIYPGRDREVWIDSSILTVAAASIMALLLIGPLLQSDSLSGLAKAAAIAYPLLDVALLSALVWLLIGSTRRSVTMALIATAFLVTLVGDVVRDIGLLVDPLAHARPSLAYLQLAALILLAAAAWTPTAESFANRRTEDTPRESTPRLAFLAVGVLSIPVLLTYEIWHSENQSVVLLSLAATTVIILAVWRIQLLVSAVQHQRRLTELILDSAGDGVIGLDREGFVLFANLSARRMLRCRESDLVGHRFHDVAHHERPDGSSFPWQECPMHSAVTSTEVSFQTDQRYIRRDGSAFPVEIVLSPLVIDGVVTGAVQSFRDVSEREEVEEIKRQFVTVVSHELRTPLTSIKGSLQMLASGLLGPLTPDQDELVRIAEGNSARLSVLVNDILDMERLDAGRMPLTPEVVSAAQIAKDAVEGIASAAHAAGIPIHTDFLEGPDVMIEADPHRMIQVLTNLIGNAIKFSERGASVVVSVSGSDEAVTMSVIDHGRGIPEDRLQHVFDRFGQIEVGDARRGGGTGLGLPIAKEIVERSGGTLSVQSTLGAGSTFTVEMPPAVLAGVGEGAS